MPCYRIKVGSVSWINRTPNPFIANWGSQNAKRYSPEWIPKTYLGLEATCNDQPPNKLEGFRTFQGNKDYRALTYCDFNVSVDDKSDRVTGFTLNDQFVDKGWTPPFSVWRFPAGGLGDISDTYLDRQHHPGEGSPISSVATRARHENSAFKIPLDEQVLVNGLNKMRAGPHTDEIGVKKVGCPYHVPWVWCEMALTYARGKFKLYGSGSDFPSHAWYVNGDQVRTVGQVGDSDWPVLEKDKHAVYTLNTAALAIYPILTRGAPATGPQIHDTKPTGPVYNHPYTVRTRKEFSMNVDVVPTACPAMPVQPSPPACAPMWSVSGSIR
jgi:hypothetical protein